jgi:hypothetical protein
VQSHSSQPHEIARRRCSEGRQPARSLDQVGLTTCFPSCSRKVPAHKSLTASHPCTSQVVCPARFTSTNSTGAHAWHPTCTPHGIANEDRGCLCRTQLWRGVGDCNIGKPSTPKAVRESCLGVHQGGQVRGRFGGCRRCSCPCASMGQGPLEARRSTRGPEARARCCRRVPPRLAAQQGCKRNSCAAQPQTMPGSAVYRLYSTCGALRSYGCCDLTKLCRV